MTTNLASTDKSVIQLLRERQSQSISQMVEQLGVTATAVRQRLNRLVAAGLVERCEEQVGRGRPVHQYSLTESGFRASGNNLSDLAKVLWEQIHLIDDEKTRKKVVEGAVTKLTELYRDSISGDTLEERLNSIATLFGQREIPFAAVEENGETVLQVVGCPYPELSDVDGSICDLEQALISGLAKQELHVVREPCGCNGTRCTFQSADQISNLKNASLNEQNES